MPSRVGYGALRSRSRVSNRNRLSRYAPYARTGQRLLPYLQRGLQAVGGYMSATARNRLAAMAGRRGAPVLPARRVRSPRQVNYFTGFRGRNYKKAKRRQLKTFGRGASHYYEFQGIATNISDQKYPVVLGHSQVYIKTVEVFAFAIIQLMFRRAGIAISSWDDILITHLATPTTTRALRVEWNYSLSEEASSTTNSFDQSVGGIYRDVATSFYLQILNAITKATDNVAKFSINYVEMFFFNDDGTTGTGNLQTFRLNVPDVMLDISMRSVMKFQNRTNATTAVDSLDDSAVNIDRNPLVGRSYDAIGNGFKPKVGRPTGGSHKFTGDNANGVITVVLPADTQPLVADNLYLKPPPPDTFVGCRKFATVRLSPGQIRTSVLTYRKKMSATSFLRMITDIVKWSADVQAPYCHLGKSRLFFFEKVLNTGVSEPAIEVGYQKEDYIQIVASRKATRTVPLYTTTV